MNSHCLLVFAGPDLLVLFTKFCTVNQHRLKVYLVPLLVADAAVLTNAVIVPVSLYVYPATLYVERRTKCLGTLQSCCYRTRLRRMLFLAVSDSVY